MAGKPTEPSAARPPEGARGAEEGEQADSSERCGPVAIERLFKDDGRRLILYSRAEGRR